MAEVDTVRQQRETCEPGDAGCAFAKGMPPMAEWRRKARHALVSDDAGIEGNGRVIRTAGASAGFVLEPLISGRPVCARYGATRQRSRSPTRPPAVIRWLSP